MDYHHAIQHAKNCATVAKFEPEGPEWSDYRTEYEKLCQVCLKLFPKDDLREVDGIEMCSDCERIEP